MSNTMSSSSMSVVSTLWLFSLVLLLPISGNAASGDSGGSVVDVHGEPVIPPIRGEMDSMTFNGIPQKLDGLSCENCTFENMTLVYAGGNFKLTQPRFKGNVSLELKGAAKNTILLLEFIKAMSAPSAPKHRPNPDSNPKVPIARTVTLIDFTTLSTEK